MLERCCNYPKQCWNNVVAIRNYVATMLKRCVALEIVEANRLVEHHFNAPYLQLYVSVDSSPRSYYLPPR